MDSKQPPAGSTTSNNNSSMSDNVVKAPGQVVPVPASWNVENTTATVNTPSTNIQTLSRNVIYNTTPTKSVSPMMYTGRPKYSDQSTFNVCTPNNGQVKSTTSENVTEFNIQ